MEPHRPADAGALNVVHASRYPPTKTTAEARDRESPRRRYTPSTSTMTGAADGSIIATIMTAHITNNPAQSAAPAEGALSGPTGR